MKKSLFLFALVLLVLTFAFRDDTSDLNTSGLAKNSKGKNIVSSGILSDPTVLYTNDFVSSIKCKFPKKWEYVSQDKNLSGEFIMWFTSLVRDKLVISRAESKNGLIWDQTQEVALEPGLDFDKIGVETASVLKDHNLKYRMYYSSSFEDNNNFYIGLALSDDGKNWSKKISPVFEAKNEWEKGESSGVLEPSVIYDKEEKIYKMWYSGLGERNGKSAFRIGYATSADGLNWQRLTYPVLEPGSGEVWDDVLVSHVNVSKSQNGYHLFYFGVSDWDDGASFQKGAIGHAYSADGINWQKNPNNPIIKPREGFWDTWTVGGPSSLILENEIWLWYFGNHRKDSFKGGIGLVRGTCE